MIKFLVTKKLPASQLYVLYQSVGWTDGVDDLRKHGRLLARVYANSDLVVSAWDRNKLVGTIRAITDKFAHGDIYGLAVNPGYRKQGLGKQLIERVLAKYPRIQWSAEAEEPAVELFKQLGFQESSNKYLVLGNPPI